MKVPGQPRRSTRPRARARRAALLASVAVAVVGRQADAATSTPFTVDVNQSTAIFQLANVAPGVVGSKCLLVTVTNGVADNAVLSAVIGGTGLAPYLDLVIESGTSANPAVCNDFVGAPVFTGTLAALANQHPDGPSGLAVTLPDQHSTVMRFTVSLQSDNAAQGRSATVTLRFDALDTTPTPPPTTVPPTTAPTTVADTTAGPPTTLRPTTVPVAPGTTSAPRTTVPASTTTTTTIDIESRRVKNGAGTTKTTIAGGAAGTTLPDELVSPTTEPNIVVEDPARDARSVSAVERAAELVSATVTTAAETSSVPALFVALVLGFLVIQDRIDRNDPKLARAPIAPEPELVYQPRSGIGS